MRIKFPLWRYSKPLGISSELKRKESKMLKSREELKTLVHIKAPFNTTFYTSFSLFKRAVIRSTSASSYTINDHSGLLIPDPGYGWERQNVIRYNVNVKMQIEVILQPYQSVTLYIERNKYRLFSASNLSYNNKQNSWRAWHFNVLIL